MHDDAYHVREAQVIAQVAAGAIHCKPLSKTAEAAHATAEAFVKECKRLGFSFSARNDIVTVAKNFTPGDRDIYVRADGDAPGLLAMLPTVAAGSQWGTDGGSVGGAAGLSGGYFRLNQSGVSKRVIKALGAWLQPNL